MSHPGKENQRPIAHECLGEVLRILRQVINTYPLLNTVEILTAAGKLISKVKGQLCVQRNETEDISAIYNTALSRTCCDIIFSAVFSDYNWTHARFFRFPLWGL